MSQPINVLAMIHGMIPDAGPSSPYPTYNEFWNALCGSQPSLRGLISDRVYVQWGHDLPGLLPADLRPDQKLGPAQRFAGGVVSYTEVKTAPSRYNVIRGDFNSIVIPRSWGVQPLREGIVLRGLGDVMYYCSPEGERQVRRVVYEQILIALNPFVDAEEVRLHLFGHSLGVALTHDFLYGLFAPEHEPDFVRDQQGSDEAVRLFVLWRQKAKDKKLRLGSLASAASQLPLFAMRKQKLVDKLAAQELLEPRVIGIEERGRVQWKIFYDVDDIFAFATRNLYKPSTAIMDIQVDCADWPPAAHTAYYLTLVTLWS